MNNKYNSKKGLRMCHSAVSCHNSSLKLMNVYCKNVITARPQSLHFVNLKNKMILLPFNFTHLLSQELMCVYRWSKATF